MADKIQVDIVTPASTVLSDFFNMAVVHSLDGEIGLLSDHIPIISTLKDWPVKLKKDDGTELFAHVSGGFLEMRDNKITILATAAELVADIDEARARAARTRAEKRLLEKTEKVDVARAEASLQRAIGRIKTIELSK